MIHPGRAVPPPFFFAVQDFEKQSPTSGGSVRGEWCLSGRGLPEADAGRQPGPTDGRRIAGSTGRYVPREGMGHGNLPP